MSSINVPAGPHVPCAGTVARVIDGPPPAPFVPDPTPVTPEAPALLRGDGLPTLEGYVDAGYPAEGYERFLENRLAEQARLAAMTPEELKKLEAEHYGLNLATASDHDELALGGAEAAKEEPAAGDDGAVIVPPADETAAAYKPVE